MYRSVSFFTKRLVRICAVFAFFALPYLSQAARVVKSSSSKRSDGSCSLENMRGGITYDGGLLSYNVGVFLEYNFGIPFIGLRTGLEYGMDGFMVMHKGFDPSAKKSDSSKDVINQDEIKNRAKSESQTRGISDEVNSGTKIKDFSPEFKEIFKDLITTELGVYKVNFLSIPLIARLYPFAGDFCMFAGLRFDYLLSAAGRTVNNTSVDDANNLSKDNEKDQSLDSIKKMIDDFPEIDKQEKGINDEVILNSTRWRFVAGIDHTFFFGLIIGLKYSHGLSSFVKYNPEKCSTFLDFNLQGTLGLDIIKIINLF